MKIPVQQENLVPFKNSVVDFFLYTIVRPLLLKQINRAGFKKGIPLFFYRDRMFEKLSRQAILIGTNTHIKTSLGCNEQILRTIEGLFTQIDYALSKEIGNIVINATAPNIDKEILGILETLHFWVESSAGKASFPLCQAVTCKQGYYEIILSQAISSLWVLDITVDIDLVNAVLKEIDNPFARQIIRMSLSGFSFSDQYKFFTLERAINSLNKDSMGWNDRFAVQCIFSKEGEMSDKLRIVGLECGEEQKIYFIPQKRTIFNCPNIFKNGQFMEMIKRLQFSEVEKALIINNQEIEKPKKKDKDGKGTFFEAETIDDAENFLAIAKQCWDENVTKEALQDVFEEFKNYWGTEKHTRKKNWQTTWKNWIQKQDAGYTVIHFEKTIAMQEGVNVGIQDQFILSEEYDKFYKYYLANKARRKSWVSTWGLWLKNTCQNQTHPNSTYAHKVFYAAKMVNLEIRQIIAMQGFLVDDIINGEAEFNEIILEEIPIPPLGKSTEMLFFWRDAEKQQKAQAKYLAESQITFDNNYKNMVVHNDKSIA